MTLKLPFKGRKNYRGRLMAGTVGWRLELSGDKAEQALGFTLDEVREARLVPVVDFKAATRSHVAQSACGAGPEGIDEGQGR